MKIFTYLFVLLFICSSAFAVNPKAKRVDTDTSNFDGNLSGSDTTVQLALETIDELAVTGAPTDATYITQTANGTLSAEQALGALATGILKNTTTTGVLSIATAGTDYFSASSHVDHDATTNFVANEHIDWTSASAGTIHATNYVDNDTTTNETITLSGDASGSGTSSITVTIANDAIEESMLKAVNVAVDEDIVTYEATTGDFEYHTPSELITAGDNISWTGSTLNVTAHTIDTNLTQEEVEDFAGALINDGTGTHTGIAVTYQDATGDVDFVVDHDAATNFVANEHIDHTSVTLTAGAGLGGGGDISTNRSFTTASGEADFLASGALTCGASTQGKAQVHTTPLQYCDNAATPTLQYAAYGNSSGVATSATALAANGSNCSAGSYPLGVDASGAVESCTDATTEIDSAISTHAGNATAHQALVTLAGTPDYLTIVGQEITRGTIDISDDTNLTGDTEIVLTGDTLSIASTIARDSELHSAVTVSGTPDYITLSGQDIVRGTVDIGDDTNLTCGTNCTLTGDEISVDDAFLLNTGDIGTGTFDFGGADDLEIPNGTAPTIDTSGQVALDTTASDFIYYNSSVNVLTPRLSSSITVESPADADNILWFKAPYALTITDIECIVDPADTGESAVITVQEADGNGDTPAGIDGATTITCANTTTSDDGALSNGTIDADDYVLLDIGTVTGTVTQLSVRVKFTKDRQ